MEWEKLIRAAMERREPPLEAVVYQDQYWRTASRPALMQCGDGQSYVVKGRQAARMAVSEAIVAELGKMIGAPVLDWWRIDVPKNLINRHPEQLGRFLPGIGFGSLFLSESCGYARIAHVDLPDNRPRFALLALLYGWVHANDREMIYRQQPPQLVYSIDHGHFFPDGHHWNIESLANAELAVPDAELVKLCAIKSEELRPHLPKVAAVGPTDLARAVAAPCESWGITLVERVAVAEYLTLRQSELLASLED